MRESIGPEAGRGDFCVHGNTPSTCPLCAAKNVGPRFDADRVRAAVESEKFFPGPLVDAFKEDPELKRRFEADAGVIEKYTVERHTLMAMVQFERYFADKPLPAGMDKGLFRTMMALHDIGKPDAVGEGNVGLQHERTVALVRPALKKLGREEGDIRLVEALLGGDPIGRYLKTRTAPERWAKQIVDAAEKAGKKPGEYFSLLLTFFKADAGAYTSDAGGKPTLDAHFTFDRQAREMALSEDYQDRIDELESAVADEAGARRGG